MPKTSRGRSAAAQQPAPNVLNPPVDLDAALRELFRRQVRALVSAGVRMVCLAMLSAWLVMVSPWLRANRFLLDAIGGTLVLWPLFSAVGRNWQWRIALGKRLGDLGRFADAEDVLSPLDGIQGQLFDARGDGRAVLTDVREKLGREKTGEAKS